MTSRCISIVLSVSLVAFPGFADAQDHQTDDISKLLFETYIARPGKIESDSIRAATHLITVRGRNSSFWKEVLAELKKNNKHSEIGCVRILGKMLAIDASARDSIRRQKETGELEQWMATVRLGPEVVTELIDRGKQADRLRIDHYVIALTRARVPEAKDFFVGILRAKQADDPSDDVAFPEGPYYRTTARFHAAVGLAQLGEPLGVDWLIANCENPNGSVFHAWPRGAATTSLDRCCTVALQQLSGKRELASKADWEAWSKTVGKSDLTSHAVDLVEQSCW